MKLLLDLISGCLGDLIFIEHKIIVIPLFEPLFETLNPLFRVGFVHVLDVTPSIIHPKKAFPNQRNAFLVSIT